MPNHSPLSILLALLAITGATHAADPSVVAQGSYPDLAADDAGSVHLVYVRDGILYHRVRDTNGSWQAETSTGLSSGLVSRSDPEIAIDSQGRPHVLVGSSYAYRDGGSWIAIDPGVSRDTAMAIDGNDTVYVCRRGGHGTGYLGVRKRAANSNQFTALPDPDVDSGLPLGRNDHVYGHLFINPADDSVHVVYRHGEPNHFAYRGSNNGGQSWFGGGVSGDDAEAPSGVAADDGTIYVVGGAGTVYKRTGTPSQWQNLGRALLSGGRDLPALAVDGGGRVYAASFGGRYNVGTDGSWVGEQFVPRLSNQSLGFVELAPAGQDQVYAVWEEGPNVNDDAIAGTSDIVFATIDADGTIGGTEPDPTDPPDPPQGVTVD